MINFFDLGLNLEIISPNKLKHKKYSYSPLTDEKGKMTTLQWKNLADITLTKRSQVTSPVITRADHHAPLITYDEKATPSLGALLQSRTPV